MPVNTNLFEEVSIVSILSSQRGEKTLNVHSGRRKGIIDFVRNNVERVLGMFSPVVHPSVMSEGSVEKRGRKRKRGGERPAHKQLSGTVVVKECLGRLSVWWSLNSSEWPKEAEKQDRFGRHNNAQIAHGDWMKGHRRKISTSANFRW